LVSPQLRIPELKPLVDVRTLPLSAVEGYVLSRIDGRCSVTEISALTGLAADMVLGIVEKLRSFGAVHYQDEAPPKPPTGTNPFDGRPDTRTSNAVDPTSDRPTREHVSVPPRPRSGPPLRRSGSPPGRRMMSEAGVSSPPPGMRSPRNDGPRTGTFSSPPTNSRMASPGAARDPRAQAHSLPPEDSRSPPKAFVSEERVRQPAPKKPTPQRAQPANDTQRTRVAEPPPEKRLYDPRELDEESDLPLERKKQLLDLYYRLETLDYYEALGVDYTADKKDIRAAYFALSKIFHPDSMFRKNLGSFKPKMEAAFRFLTEGYETLSKKKNRDEYDAYLRSTIATKMAEQALRRQAEHDALPPPEPPKAPSLPPAPQFTPSPEPPSVPTPREMTDEGRRLAREVVARRLRGVKPPPHRPTPEREPVRSVVPPPPVSPPEVPASRTDPQ
jgi:hypothetical protein